MQKIKKIRNFTLILIAICLVGYFIYSIVTYNHISAKEWFQIELGYFYKMQDIAEQLDTTVSVYISGNIDKEAYISNIDIIKTEYNILLNERANEKDDYYIEIDSYNYANKAGPEAIERVYDIIGNMIEDSGVKYADDKNQLAYLYLAHSNQMLDEIATIGVCVEMEFKEE